MTVGEHFEQVAAAGLTEPPRGIGASTENSLFSLTPGATPIRPDSL